MEIVTGGEVRREYTPVEQAAVLTNAKMPGARGPLGAQLYGILPSLFCRWRREEAGRPARQAMPRAPRFVPLLVDDGAYGRPQPCRPAHRCTLPVPPKSR
jgi:hypothetical protein